MRNEKFITQIGSGDDFTAFLTHDNTLFVAGLNDKNMFGLKKTKDLLQRYNPNNNPYYYSSAINLTDMIIDEPSVIFRNEFKTESISHLSCGSNHICVVTQKRNIYFCGFGECGFVKLPKNKYGQEYEKSEKLEPNTISMVGSGLNFSVFIVNRSDIYMYAHRPVSQHTYYYATSFNTTSFFDGAETSNRLVLKSKKDFESDSIVALACGKSHFVILTDSNELYGYVKDFSIFNLL